MERALEIELREHTIMNFFPVSISIDEQISEAKSELALQKGHSDRPNLRKEILHSIYYSSESYYFYLNCPKCMNLSWGPTI